MYVRKGLSEIKSGVTSFEALCSPKYRRASFNGMLLMLFDQFTGVTGIYMHSTGIFKKMKEEGEFSFNVELAT